MVSKVAALAFDLGAHSLFIWGRYLLYGALNSGGPAGSRGPMAISKGIALALDLGTPSCSRSPLAFDLWPQLAQGAPSSKRASLTLDLGTSPALGANWFLM